MKYKDKAAFMQAVQKSWDSLLLDLRQIKISSKHLLETRVTLKAGATACSVKDVCAHVHAWHRLTLGWQRQANAGKTPNLPAKGFNWRQTPELNSQFYKEFMDTPYESIRRRMVRSHNQILSWITPLSNDQLMNSGRYESGQWTGKLGLISYVSANTDSHYRWAIRKIKKIQASQR